jgi:hypothetical protein
MSDFFLPQMGDVLTEGVILALFADASGPRCAERGVKKGGCLQKEPGSCALDASSFLLPIPRRERRATRVVGETRSSGPVGVHHIDILIDEKTPCIRSRERYLLAIRRPGGFVFYDGLGTGEVGLACAVGVHHVEVRVPYEDYLAVRNLGVLVATAATVTGGRRPQPTIRVFSIVPLVGNSVPCQQPEQYNG